MPTRAAKTAEDVADTVADTFKSMIDRLVDAELTKEITRRGQDVAGAIADRGSDVAELASDAWRETRGTRRDAAKRVAQVTGDAAKRSDSVWRGAIAPVVRDLWQRRTVAAGAAGAALPAGRELLESAAVRLGLRERQKQEERRRWGVFFLGMVLGAVGGAVIALLTTPKRGSEVRKELGVRADDVRRELGVRADDIASRAREADWMPVFQREGGENGHGTSPGQATSPRESTSPRPTPPRRPAAPRSTLQPTAADSGVTAPKVTGGQSAEQTPSAPAGRKKVDRQPPT